jgi:hypothetical protein
MVCSHCNCPGHNQRRCPRIHDIAPPSEMRAAKSLSKLLDQKPKVKKSPKALEGLAGCKNIWKETTTKAKKSQKPLEGLAGCKNIWKVEPVERSNKGNTTCKLCGCKGHNARTCPNTAKMPECVQCSHTPMWMFEYKASVIQKHVRGWNIRTARNHASYRLDHDILPPSQ